MTETGGKSPSICCYQFHSILGIILENYGDKNPPYPDPWGSLKNRAAGGPKLLSQAIFGQKVMIFDENN